MGLLSGCHSRRVQAGIHKKGRKKSPRIFIHSRVLPASKMVSSREAGWDLPEFS
jgi:hypothetical protein